MQGAHDEGDWSTPRRVVTGSTALRTPPRPATRSAGVRTESARPVGAPIPTNARPVAGAPFDRDLATVRRAAAGFGASGPPRRATGETLRDFVRRYGWRAYALPLLSVLTVVALTTTQDPTPHATTPAAAAAGNSVRSGAAQPTSQPTTSPTSASLPPVAADRMPLKSDHPDQGGTVNGTVLKAGALPAGPSFTAAGDGTFRTLPGFSTPVGQGPLYRYSIDVENGIRGINLAAYARLVQSTLADPRSWSGHGVSLQRVDSGQIDFHITLTSQMTVRRYCGYDVQAETSCYAPPQAAGGVARVILNDARWVRGASAYIGDLAEYRIYMINHEDGHALGHRHAHNCLPGGWAPVMMQQTYGLIDATTHRPCKANPWPYPPGVAGTPGAEQADTARNDELRLMERYGS